MKGTAYSTTLQPLSGANLQIRNLDTGVKVGSTFSGARGEFAIEHLPPGTYIAEIVDAAGTLLGMSAPFALGGAPTVTVSVVAVAAAVTAVVATRQDASPSR